MWTIEDCTLVDDGTLDTVVVVRGMGTFRYSQELVAEYRDENGRLDFAAFCDEVVLEERHTYLNYFRVV